MKILISLMLLIVMFSSCQKAPAPLELPWKPYSKQLVEDSAAHQRPVVIDFWAEWCPNCHDLDRVVLSRPDVQEKLAHMTALRMDVTNQDDPEVQKILQEYNIDGVPTVVFLDGHGHEISNARVIGFVTPKEFLQSLAQVAVLK